MQGQIHGRTGQSRLLSLLPSVRQNKDNLLINTDAVWHNGV